MVNHHIFDPKHVAALESEDRKNWQNPKEIIELMELKSSYVVADLGCGTGYFTVPIARKVKKVYGIDIQEEMLKFFGEKIQQQKIGNIETLLSKENKIPLQDKSVDLVFSANTLHEFRDKEAIIDEMQRVLKADGQIVMIDFRKEDTGVGPPVSVRVSKEQAKRIFKEKGLTALKTYGLKFHYLIVFGNTKGYEGVR
jgi:ubiquinone/menaquinone biosynthesis C-methylase UbiE